MTTRYYDRRYKNQDIKHMAETLLDQVRHIYQEIGIIEVRASALPPDEQFHDAEIKDKLTNFTLAVQNLHTGTSLLWKRTRQ